MILKKQLMNLKNKKVIISGATGGIGNSLVKRFAEEGAIVFATGTKEEKLKNLKKNLTTYKLKYLILEIIQKLKLLLIRLHKNLVE